MSRALRFSRRTDWDLAANAWAVRVEALRKGGQPFIDLGESNPTRCGFAWPAQVLAAALVPPEISLYEPDPLGVPAAREAISAYLAGHGAVIDPGQVLLTASTSEAYAVLLKLLCDPGDEVLVPSPSYPLLDVLCELELVGVVRYPLLYDGAWRVDLTALSEAVTDRTRAVVIVSPSNPTGALLTPSELAGIEALCEERGLALVGDEVFADTALGPKVSVLAARRCLAFGLSGLSKVCGLPQIKAAWIAVSGPAAEVARAEERLDMILDSYLSVSSSAQLALPALLGDRARFLLPLRERLAANRALLSREASQASLELLDSGGGWSAVLRIGESVDEEALSLALLEDGVVAQPGFLYDFERQGHLVVSLLPEAGAFAQGVERVVHRLRGHPS